jgi:hypothetical protein
LVDEDLADEQLPETPSRWYLTGYIVPADDAARLTGGDPAGDEEIEGPASEDEDFEGDVAAAAGRPDDQPTDGSPAQPKFLPSSIGLSFLVEQSIDVVDVEVSWGDYRTEPELDQPWNEESEAGKGAGQQKVDWVRVPRRATVRIQLSDGRLQATKVEDSAGFGPPGGFLMIEGVVRPTPLPGMNGERTVRSVSLFLVNRRRPVGRKYQDLAYAFQVRLDVKCDVGFVAKYDMSDYGSPDPDRRLADLHYRDVCDFAVGLNTSADWENKAGKATRIWTEPLPQAEICRVAANENINSVELGMERLAELAEQDGVALNEAIVELVSEYGSWIEAQGRVTDLGPERQATARSLIVELEKAQARIADGIELLRIDKDARRAFGFMNLAVAMAARQRVGAEKSADPLSLAPPKWRPFQLAFILLNLAGLTNPLHADRETVDLLFFPTGGGKTEAYLGLAAFTIAHRRLTNPGLSSAGVAVVMRYTLRLLTLDQLSRASGVICALELMRRDPRYVDQGRPMLGNWPIEIGLWVGGDASPNRFKDGRKSAVARVRKFQQDGKSAPAPIKSCPWCGTALVPESFRIRPNVVRPKRLEVGCTNHKCPFSGELPLPVVVVDEEIYRRLPSFIVATVDKFAALPWNGHVGAFFGHVDRFVANEGFVGPIDGPGGDRLNAPLLPPALIIQDELHLISGPLGTIAGLYEAAIDGLCRRKNGEHVVRPKVVASTATVRRAATQVKALFDRKQTAVFPPPGVNRTDSYFAHTVPSTEDPARLYVGVAAPGKGQKLVFLRALRTLLSAAKFAFDAGERDAADPYMTAVAYFNALRELGSARRIVEDEVNSALKDYGSRRRRRNPDTAELANRIIGEPLELTSRVSTDDVAKAKKKLETQFSSGSQAGADVALATNMISVGLDITRLGLMVVNGQPKTTSEYIQATSRVGRDHERPGLVVTLLSHHKPRDRAHYESFKRYHAAFYRAVEATSVTPWAPRALDRALAAVVVGLARHLQAVMEPEPMARSIGDHASVRDEVVRLIADRASRADDRPLSVQEIQGRVTSLFENWEDLAAYFQRGAQPFAYSRSGAQTHLLREMLDPHLDQLRPGHANFRAPRSMRGVEPNVLLQVENPRGVVLG